jgi:hypothetical protein
MYPEVYTLAGATLRWSGMHARGTPNATMARRILFEPSHQKGNHRSTKGHLRVVIEPVQGGEVHKLIGGSQLKSTKVTNLGQIP